jgi:hypothetical protein
MIAFTYIISGVLLAISGYLFAQEYSMPRSRHWLGP